MIAQPIIQRALTACLLTVLAACSWDDAVVLPPVPETSRIVSANDTATRAAGFALDQRGAPYRYGGSSPQGFDCSGLVHYAYGLAGKSVPRTARDQHAATEAIGKSSLRAGDLVFFEIGGKMSHVGIYLDDGRFVHAPQSGRTVSVESLDSEFYRRAFLRGGRFRDSRD